MLRKHLISGPARLRLCWEACDPELGEQLRRGTWRVHQGERAGEGRKHVVTGGGRTPGGGHRQRAQMLDRDLVHLKAACC